MKKRFVPVLASLIAFSVAARQSEPIGAIELQGVIAGDHLTMEMKFAVSDLPEETPLAVLEGDVALLQCTLPEGFVVEPEGKRHMLIFRDGFWKRRGGGDVTLEFALLQKTEGDKQSVSFAIPVTAKRRISIVCDRTGLDVEMPCARDVVRDKSSDGSDRVSGYLGFSQEVALSWKTAVRKLESELIATSDALTSVKVAPGSVYMRSLITYTVAQGELTEMAVDVPGVNIIQVSGKELRDWRVDTTDPEKPVLRVTLGRPQKSSYLLTVEYERAIPAFPCEFTIASLAPRGVIRSAGKFLVGTDSEVRLQISSLSGLTQTDPSAFPAKTFGTVPSKSVFTYQYAASPNSVTLKADNIVTTVNAETAVLCRLEDGMLVVEAGVQLDVRDAAAREVSVSVAADSSWTVSAVNGQHVAEHDVDIRSVDGGREILVPFRQPVLGGAVVNIRLEKTFNVKDSGFEVPAFAVKDARSQRGYVVAAASQGIRLSAAETGSLIEVHTASTPLRTEGAQLAYRFREPGWKLRVAIERANSSIHAEIFHLISLGEGVAYVSAAVTCHVSGAPVQSLSFRIPEHIRSYDITGANIDAWSRNQDICTVKLMNRVIGDYTVLITYDMPLDYKGGELVIGEIELIDTESELGFLAIATAASLKLEEGEDMPKTLIRIGREEIPPAYAATVTAPVIGAYKYVRRPHAATLKVTPYETEGLISQVVDYLTLSTKVARDCESVTRAVYSLKNASLQYLSLTLPENAVLWSVRQVNDVTGQLSDLSAQQADGTLLVPVDRPRDPNQAVSIEVIYAMKGEKGRRKTALGAPVLTDAPVTFARWEVTAGDKVALRRVEGNMTEELARPALRLPVYDRDYAGNRRFYRTANLAGERPLELDVEIIPSWLGGGSLSVLFGSAVLCMFCLIAGLITRSRFWYALMLTALFAGASQIEYGLRAVAIIVVVLVPLLLAVGFVRVVRKGLRKRRAGKKDAALRTDPLDRPPLIEGDPRESSHPASSADESGKGAKEPGLSASGASGRRDSGHGSNGFARPGLPFIIVLLGLLLLALPLLLNAKPAKPADLREIPLVAVCTNVAETLEEFLFISERTAIAIAPRSDDGEYVSAVTRTIEFSIEKTGAYRLLRADSPNRPALVSFEDAEDAVITADLKGVILNIRRKGRYTLKIETRETVRENPDGTTAFAWQSFGGIMSAVSIVLPSMELDVTGSGIARFVNERAGESLVVSGVLTTGTTQFGVSFRPRVRDARKEQVVLYCDLSTLARVRSGVVDITSWADFTVAQGELREVGMRIPANMGVVSVTAPDLATWSLDPLSGLLTVVFAKPRTGSFPVQIGMQSACGGLPYDVTLGAPTAANVQRERGFLALAASESVLLKPGESSGVTPVNTADFRLPDKNAVNESEPLRRAWRYDDASKVSIALKADAVKPEIRVEESASFSIGDERYILSTKIDVTISKAGLFSIVLNPPAGYEIETLTGSGVSHWDDTRKSGGAVEVFFTTRLTGTSSINLVLTRQQQGIDPLVEVPRVTVEGELRHTGRMTVSAERGVRLTLEERQGVSVVRDEKLRAQAGVMVFDILRSAWKVALKTQVLQPVLKPELLHRVDLSEGMLQHRVFARYKIENAGVKVFRVAVPVKDATLTVSGKGIARVTPEGGESADGMRLWLIELHGKVESEYRFTAFYQEPYDPAAGGVVIRPFGTPGTERQRAWLAVTGGGRVQVEPRGEVEGLRVEDARSLPDDFGAGDLSGAIRCYRILQPDYRLDLSVIRHEAAQVLLAGVENTLFTTVLSGSGKMLTQASIQLRTGRLRFLKVALPVSSDLWAAQVNGTEVAVARDSEGNLTVPLELLTSEQSTAISLVYADTLPGALDGTVEIPAVSFPDLPLQNIRWNLYVPPGARYRLANRDFDEVERFNLDATGQTYVKTFGKQQYLNINKELGSRSLNEAKRNLGNIGELLDKGDRIQAQKALQQAVNLSQAEQTLNEDARVQFRNVVREQVKMGLVNRRQALRMDNNIFDESAVEAQTGYNDGNFSREFVSRVDQQLSQQDRASLDLVALRIVEQQAAAAGQGSAINIAMPEQGRLLQFSRALQNECGAKMALALKVRPDYGVMKLLNWWIAPVLLIGLWLLLRIAFGPRRTKAFRS